MSPLMIVKIIMQKGVTDYNPLIGLFILFIVQIINSFYVIYTHMVYMYIRVCDYVCVYICICVCI